MPSCAFLTMANQDGWFIDDHLVHEPLRQLGWRIDDTVWQADIDWNVYNLVVIRSPWDYQKTPQQFFSVLERIDKSSATLQNSLDLVTWNLNKRYLLDLESRGIEIVRTLPIHSPTHHDVRRSFQHFDTDGLVIKPVIGANADETYRVSRDVGAGGLEEICVRFAAQECLVQPFMNGVILEGEFSLIYFDGRFSHAIIKTARGGDFRVQEEHGGGVLSVPEPEPELIAAADRIMGVLPETPLYARVDLVRTERNSFALMELELIEPSLYFRFGHRAALRFAETIVGLS